MHHFSSPSAAIGEAYRVLRGGGAFVSIGLDPHAAPGTWFVYEFFPTTLPYDLQRFPSRTQRVGWFQDAGFEGITVGLAERVATTITLDEAIVQGRLGRSFTSQLTTLTEAQYSEGMRRIRIAAESDPSFRLRVDLELHSTAAWKPV